MMLRPRNAYRIRRAAAVIARTVRQNPGLMPFPVLQTSEPEIRARHRAEIVVLRPVAGTAAASVAALAAPAGQAVA